MRAPARSIGLALVAALAVGAGCSDADDGSGPVAGILAVSLVTPHADDGAMVVRITGPGIISVSPAEADFYLYVVGGSTVTAVVVGDLAGGEIVEISVPDVGDVEAYSATVLEVADRSNELRGSLDGYGVSVTALGG